MTIDARTLVAFIRDLDQGDAADNSEVVVYLELSRWNVGSPGGRRDDAATSLVRTLAREKLGAFPLEEIGAAVLAEIDARSDA